MDVNLADWLELALRWIHLITGIAWIGSSFYFVWLDNNLTKPADGTQGVAGELWAVHGGGFYHNRKFVVAPPALPEHLHWFKWEAYSTWISGFFLLGVLYYWGADLFLIDRAKAALSPLAAILTGLGFLFGAWVVYDLMCRSALGRKPLLFGAVWFLALLAAAFVLTHIFTDRGAFIHVGAMIGTVMVGNVFMVIIPNQKKAVATMLAGGVPEARLGIEAKQRSLHNNYMTLPVLFTMISNHYPIVFSHPANWALLGIIGAMGWSVRHFFNLRHKGKIAYQYLALPFAAFIGLMLVTATPKPARQVGAGVPFAEVQKIMAAHCTMCHSATPRHEGFAEAPKGTRFDTPEDVQRFAALIYQQTVASDIMPLGNETGMTAGERARLGAWIAAGAKIDAPVRAGP